MLALSLSHTQAPESREAHSLGMASYAMPITTATQHSPEWLAPAAWEDALESVCRDAALWGQCWHAKEVKHQRVPPGSVPSGRAERQSSAGLGNANFSNWASSSELLLQRVMVKTPTAASMGEFSSQQHSGPFPKQTFPSSCLVLIRRRPVLPCHFLGQQSPRGPSASSPLQLPSDSASSEADELLMWQSSNESLVPELSQAVPGFAGH